MTAALSREVTAARQAMDLSAMGTDEFDQALDWAVCSHAALMCALSHWQPFKHYTPPASKLLHKFPALRGVHRQEVV